MVYTCKMRVKAEIIVIVILVVDTEITERKIIVDTNRGQIVKLKL